MVVVSDFFVQRGRRVDDHVYFVLARLEVAVHPPQHALNAIKFLSGVSYGIVDRAMRRRVAWLEFFRVALCRRTGRLAHSDFYLLEMDAQEAQGQNVARYHRNCNPHHALLVYT